jgi:hypothetical protein
MNCKSVISLNRCQRKAHTHTARIWCLKTHRALNAFRGHPDFHTRSGSTIYGQKSMCAGLSDLWRFSKKVRKYSMFFLLEFFYFFFLLESMGVRPEWFKEVSKKSQKIFYVSCFGYQVSFFKTVLNASFWPFKNKMLFLTMKSKKALF